MSKIAVVKFGGTSVADEKARACAMERIREYRAADFAVAVIVSAMGRMGAPYATDTLLSLVRGLDTLPETRDMLMSCGETISACVFADALCKEGLSAIPMNGMTAGILTDDEHLSAEIIRMDTAPVMSVLNGGNVAVITGFQGVSPKGHVTTLGRGGSDTSAVCVAGYLGADETVIYTDVPGVATCDPRIVAHVRFLDEIECDDMLALATNGAGVVHPRAVEAAKRFHLPVWVRSTFETTKGTIIREMDIKPAGFIGIAVKHLGEVDTVSMVYRNAKTIEQQVAALLIGCKLTVNGDLISALVPKADVTAAVRKLYERFAHSQESVE